MNTFISIERDEEGQKKAAFTGEGAYHGASNKEKIALSTLGEKTKFELFEAFFANVCEIKAQLPVPTAAEIRDDKTSFVWALFADALAKAGPLTKRVLTEIAPLLKGDKKNVYVDSKIQFFEWGDLPVDSQLWHIDGSKVLRGEAANAHGYTLLHDMEATCYTHSNADSDAHGDAQNLSPDNYWAYQSSSHCATEFMVEPQRFMLPKYIENFKILDQIVAATTAKRMAQPAGSIVHFTGNSLHKAVPASAAGWRLWVRVLETDKEIKLSQNIIECYGTVFKPFS